MDKWIETKNDIENLSKKVDKRYKFVYQEHTKDWENEILSLKDEICEMKSLKNEMSNLKNETQSLKNEMLNLKNETLGLKSEMLSLKDETLSLKNEIQILKNQLEELTIQSQKHFQSQNGISFMVGNDKIIVQDGKLFVDYSVDCSINHSVEQQKVSKEFKKQQSLLNEKQQSLLKEKQDGLIKKQKISSKDDPMLVEAKNQTNNLIENSSLSVEKNKETSFIEDKSIMNPQKSSLNLENVTLSVEKSKEKTTYSKSTFFGPPIRKQTIQKQLVQEIKLPTRTQEELEHIATKQQIPFQKIFNLYEKREKLDAFGRAIFAIFPFDTTKYAVERTKVYEKYPDMEKICQLVTDVTGVSQKKIKKALSNFVCDLRRKLKNLTKHDLSSDSDSEEN
jgi:hypothetical protein